MTCDSNGCDTWADIDGLQCLLSLWHVTHGLILLHLRYAAEIKIQKVRPLKASFYFQFQSS